MDIDGFLKETNFDKALEEAKRRQEQADLEAEALSQEAEGDCDGCKI
ncbi:hypothetical protein HWC59_gp32 [Proteus phage Myduc]|uniref:Uncharacterized protein n=1 Tax=Proteus phage Myduc TaxID=2650874 RepID=A0A5J6T923_9CAUD|nr:hypothetical protein HWC59_gp32 [Proteus phage Myduc]QFG06655.1 hypothetical protein CPT_Myduc_032 [Proteus phage Myduc]